MAEADLPDTAPPRDALEGLFSVYEVRIREGQLRYYGEPLASRQQILKTLWPVFRERGYELSLTTELGEHVLIAEPRQTESSGLPWVNILLAVATVGTTLFAGAQWYHISIAGSPLSVVNAWPFAAAIMGVLGIHELGHYAMSRYYDVDATLPYFIPIPTFIGTLGAVIRMRGQMPSRKVLFDIGVAGPLAGLVATIVVSVIGLLLPPITVPEHAATAANAVQIRLGFPPLLQFIAWALGQPLRYSDPMKAVNPVVIGGWVGMFVTFLNLLPVGQLDGGHILRAVLGDRHEKVAKLVPVTLFGLAGYLFLTRGGGNAVGLWAFWGVFTLVIAKAGAASPIRDRELGTKRKVLAVVTLLLGVLAFTPVPIQIVS
jgi:membrane-associated protease RseP (regulator of RpoE activity)